MILLQLMLNVIVNLSKYCAEIIARLYILLRFYSSYYSSYISPAWPAYKRMGEGGEFMQARSNRNSVPPNPPPPTPFQGRPCRLGYISKLHICYPCFMSPQINRKTSLDFTCFTFLFLFFLSRPSFSSRSLLITRMS